MVHILGGDVIEPVFVKSALETFTILIDTREHETSALTQRIQQMGCPVERQKLNFGDYSAKVILPTGVPYSLENIVVIERKMSSDEIANCFTSQRARFTREFERAKAAGARTYLLVERTTWEMLYAGTYRSKCPLSPWWPALQPGLPAMTASSFSVNLKPPASSSMISSTAK